MFKEKYLPIAMLRPSASRRNYVASGSVGTGGAVQSLSLCHRHPVLLRFGVVPVTVFRVVMVARGDVPRLVPPVSAPLQIIVRSRLGTAIADVAVSTSVVREMGNRHLRPRRRVLHYIARAAFPMKASSPRSSADDCDHRDRVIPSPS